jgi:YVTN family beta-propeller protein
LRRGALIAAALLAVGVATAVAIAVMVTRTRAPSSVATSGIAAINPRSGAIAPVPLAGPVARLAAGRRSLWATDQRDQTVVELDLETRRVDRTIGIGVDPDAIAVGEGAVWVLSGNRLLRIDPAFTFLRTIRLPFQGPAAISVGAPQSIAAGAGAVWVENGSAVYRIDPTTDKVTGHRLLGPRITGVAVGPDSVWVSRGSPPSLLRVDPHTLWVTATIPIAAHARTLAPYPIGLAVGGGAVWVLNGNTGTVTRIDPTLDSVAATVSRVSLNPTRIAFGEGALWVVDDDANSIVRIDPSTNQVAQSIPVNGFPTSVAADHGEVWVGVYTF